MKKDLSIALSIARRNNKYSSGGEVASQPASKRPKSITEAIRMKNAARGPEIKEMNDSDEYPLLNEYNTLNEKAASEDFESDLATFPQPEDSNMHGKEMSRIDRIRMKMKGTPK